MLDLFSRVNKFGDIKTLIHVGAHEGQEIPLYEKSNLNMVYLVEPISECIEILEEKISNKSNFKVLPFALGAENSSKDLFIADGIHQTSSSILEPRKSDISFTETRKIPVKTFDSLNLEKIDMAVIDTQGYEIEVLVGFKEKIYDLNFLIVEFSLSEGYKKQPTYKELYKFMLRRNFTIVAQNKFINNIVSTIKKPTYGDALFVNNSYLSGFDKWKFKIKFILLNNKFRDAVFYIFLKIKKL